MNDVELLVLLAIMRLDQEAYGVAITREIESAARRSLSLGAVYSVLDRMEQSGLVTSTLGDPTPERGGRPKRYFKLTRRGIAQVRFTRNALSTMWQGLAQLEGGRA